MPEEHALVRARTAEEAEAALAAAAGPVYVTRPPAPVRDWLAYQWHRAGFTVAVDVDHRGRRVPVAAAAPEWMRQLRARHEALARLALEYRPRPALRLGEDPARPGHCTMCGGRMQGAGHARAVRVRRPERGWSIAFDCLRGQELPPEPDPLPDRPDPRPPLPPRYQQMLARLRRKAEPPAAPPAYLHAKRPRLAPVKLEPPASPAAPDRAPRACPGPDAPEPAGPYKRAAPMRRARGRAWAGGTGRRVALPGAGLREGEAMRLFIEHAGAPGPGLEEGGSDGSLSGWSSGDASDRASDLSEAEVLEREPYADDSDEGDADPLDGAEAEDVSHSSEGWLD